MAESLQNKVISKTGTNKINPKNNSTNLSNTYQIGDLVWAKIGKFPLWPSIVCMDPDSNTYIKGIPEKKPFSLHVRFFNDHGQRSWSKTIENYFGKEHLLSKYPNYISNSKIKETTKWNGAIAEAEQLVNLDREERIKRFYIYYKLNKLTPSTSKVPQSLNTPSPAPSTSTAILKKKKKVFKRKRNLREGLLSYFGRDVLEDPVEDKNDNEPKILIPNPKRNLPSLIVIQEIENLEKDKLESLKHLKDKWIIQRT